MPPFTGTESSPPRSPFACASSTGSKACFWALIFALGCGVHGVDAGADGGTPSDAADASLRDALDETHATPVDAQPGAIDHGNQAERDAQARDGDWAEDGDATLEFDADAGPVDSDIGGDSDAGKNDGAVAPDGEGGRDEDGEARDGSRGDEGAASPCDVSWAGDLQIGTTLDDQILGMTIDAHDNIAVSGYEHGQVGVTNIEPDGDSQAVVIKYAPTGTLSWKRVLDTPGTDTAEDVATFPTNDSLLVVGRTSAAFPTFVNQGQFDLVLASLDPDGQISSVLQGGNERPAHPARLSVANNGSIAVAGWDDTYVPSNYVAANQVGFFATFTIDPQSRALSQRSLQYSLPPSETGPFSLATGVATEPDGSAVYLTSKVSTNPGGPQGTFVTKVLADNSVAWNINISTLFVDAVNAVALSPSGRLFVTGGTFLTMGARSFGQEDAFVLEIDRQSGAVVWAAQAGGPESDYPTTIGFDREGNVYIAGITLGSVSDGVPNMGEIDIFAMKFSTNGKLLSTWQAGTPQDDEITSMAVDHCGRVFVAGYTRGNLVPGHTNVGGEDMFIIKAM